MGDISALYPQPPAAPQNALASDPSKVLGIVGQLNQNALFQQEFNARKAIGQAYQQAIQPDGTIDTQSLMQGIKNNPAAGFLAGEAAAGALTRQGQTIQNTTAQLEQDAKRQGFLVDSLGTLADDPNLNFAKVRNLAVTYARNLKLPGEMVNSWLDSLPRDQAGLRDALVKLRNVAIGSPGVSAPVGTVGPNGEPMNQTHGQFNYQAAGGGVPTGLAPGEAALAESGGERASKLQATATSSPQYHADLDNLKQLSKVLDVGGPTVPWEKSFAQLASRFHLPATLTPDQLKSAEEFDKIANQISLNQSTLFHGSDAGLHTVIGANPSSSMSKFGREGVIDMLQGNQDAIDLTRRLWLRARANGAKPGDYDLFAERVGQEVDPRVFQFNRLNRENQQKFLSQMDPSDLKDFETKYKNAISKKWVAPLKPAEKANGQ